MYRDGSGARQCNECVKPPLSSPLFALTTAELSGVALTLLGAFIYTLHDAGVKWMVADFFPLQIIAIRSCTILVACVLFRSGKLLEEAVKCNHNAALLGRALLMLVSSFLYYAAALHLALAELTTLYFVGPIFMFCLAYVFLEEPLHRIRIVAVFAGFVGVGITASPSLSGAVPLWPTMFALGAALTWASAMVLTRRISASVSTLYQVASTNLLVAISAAALSIPFWKPVDWVQGIAMVGIGVCAGAGQFTLTEGVRRASISVLAPFNYSSLIWAILIGHLIWGYVPTASILIGGSIIVAAGILVVLPISRLMRRMD